MNIKRNNKALTDTDINVIKNFKSKMSFSITLLFLPIFIIVGMLFESNKILIAYIVITGIGYIYSLYSSISTSIYFRKYLKSNNDLKEYHKTLKNYNLIYWLLIYIVLSFLVLLIGSISAEINKFLIITLSSYSLYFGFISLIVIQIYKNGYQLTKNKLIYLIPSLIIFVISIIRTIIPNEKLGYVMIFYLILSQIINVVSMFKLNFKEEKTSDKEN